MVVHCTLVYRQCIQRMVGLGMMVLELYTTDNACEHRYHMSSSMLTSQTKVTSDHQQDNNQRYMVVLHVDFQACNVEYYLFCIDEFEHVDHHHKSSNILTMMSSTLIHRYN